MLLTFWESLFETVTIFCSSYDTMMGRPRMANGVLGGISDSGLPLQLSMAWLIICATPVNEQGQQEGYYSVTFISAILDLVAREAFEVSGYSRERQFSA